MNLLLSSDKTQDHMVFKCSDVVSNSAVDGDDKIYTKD